MKLLTNQSFDNFLVGFFLGYLMCGLFVLFTVFVLLQNLIKPRVLVCTERHIILFLTVSPRIGGSSECCFFFYRHYTVISKKETAVDRLILFF